MLPEDRVARTMDLQEDIAAKIEIIKKNAEVDKDAQAFKDELARITKYVTDLDANTKTECNKYSNDVKYWAEYRTGIKEFTPWLLQAEKAAGEGLIKPSSLDEVKALNNRVCTSDKTAVQYLKVLTAANDKSSEGENQFSLEKMESTLGELKNIFKEKE